MIKDEIYEDLPDEIRKGNCVLVLGMGIYRGLSRETGGLQLPDDATLTRRLAERSGYTEEPLTLPRVAQHYEWKRDRNQLIAYIQEQFDQFADKRLPVLGTICRLPFKAIITTCVDDLLERELRRQKKLYHAIISNEDVAFQKGDRLLLIKLCGTLDQKESLVLTEEDYFRFFDELTNVNVLDMVKALCAGSTLLFVGFDLEDENFRRLYHEVTVKIAKFVRRAYAIKGDIKDYTVQWWQARNVTTIDVKAPEILTELERLVFQRRTVDLEYPDFYNDCRIQVDQRLKLQEDKYNPDLYVMRAEIEDRLEDFISSDKNGVILVGDSGTGKTNALCHLASKWTDAGHLVLYYDCGGSLNIDVEGAIMRDIAPAAEVSFDVLTEQITTTAHAQGKRVIWIFDGVNEFRDGDNRAGDLLKRLDAIVGRARVPDLKLIAACRTGTWENLVMLGRARLFWSKYYPGPEQPLFLSKFTPQELEQAYPRYQQQYGMSSSFFTLTERTKESLRDPFLLRMTSVAYADKAVPGDALSIRVISHFCSIKIRQRITDTQFVDRLAALLLEQKTQAIALNQMLADPQLASGINDDPDCALQRLREFGILTLVSGTIVAVVKFTYDRVLEFCIACHWLAQVPDPARLATYLEETLPDYEEYVPAWSAAAMAVAMIPTYLDELKANGHGGSAATMAVAKTPPEEVLFGILLRLSSSLNYRVRQVAVDSLVMLHQDDPAMTEDILKRLIFRRPKRKPGKTEPAPDEKGMELPLRTALKATRMIGEGGSQVFLHAATVRPASRRDIVANELYVLWQHEPELGYTILGDIIRSIRPRLSSMPLRLLDFSARFSYGLFANNCDQTEVIQRLSDIWWEEFEERYKVQDWFGKGVTRRVLDRSIRLAARRGIAEAAMDAVTFGGAISLERFFADTEVKAIMRRVIDYLDPATDITGVLPDIVTLLSSDLIYPNQLASLILTVHTFKDFESMQGVLERLFGELPGPNRLWLLLTFVLLAPVEVPVDSMVELVEELTRRIQQDNRDDFFKGPQGIFEQCDIGLLPLGLTYGKWGLEMRYLSRMIESARVNDLPLLKRCVKGLAAVGLYYPDATLDLLERTLADQINETELEDVWVHTLATIGVIHNDKVEHFLLKTDADEGLRAQVQAHEDASLVKLYVDTVGLYNLDGYGCLFYPRIRKTIQSGYWAATESADLTELIGKIGQAYIRLVIESNYKISEMIAQPSSDIDTQAS